ncbi:chymotrypsin-elastase inhibitor ixodidin-like [Amblyomma americanum]
MQAWFLFSVAMVVALVAVFAEGQGGFPERHCGPNEVYLQCGTACPRVCGRAPPRFCTYQCVSGCFCRRGFIRASYGNCILESQCHYRG